MKPPQQHSRVNLVELKAQFVKKLGPEKSKQYFSFLHRFLSSKTTKFELNKLCLTILGRENIPLHNRFISSLLKNVCTAKSPPPAVHKGIVTDGYHTNGSHGILPISPRKPRSGVSRHCSAREKARFSPRVTADESGDSNVVLEKGCINPPNIEILGQKHEEIARKSGNKNEILTQESAKNPLQAPFGVLWPRAQGAMNQGNSNRCEDMFFRGALLDNVTLRERMENTESFQGLKGVSVDCAEVVNHGLDSYLKGLIGSCIELVGGRSGTENGSYKNQPRTKKLFNGLKPENHEPQMQNSSSDPLVSVSLHDFRAAMELNPKQLGEHWPLLLEKISTREFEE